MVEDAITLKHAGASMHSISAKGKYIWHDAELLLHLQSFAPLLVLIDFVEKTRTKRFYEPSERFEILMLMFMLRRKAPFCEDRRFPEEYWVNLSVGPISEALDRLQSAIDMPDPQLLIHMSVSDFTYWKQMYDTAMSDLRKYVYCTDDKRLAETGVYKRVTFEQTFGLQWQE